MTYNTIFKIYISIFISIIVTIIAVSGITFLGDNWIIPDTYHLFNTAKYDTHFHSPIFIISIKHPFYFSS